MTWLNQAPLFARAPSISEKCGRDLVIWNLVTAEQESTEATQFISPDSIDRGWEPESRVLSSRDLAVLGIKSKKEYTE